MTKTIENLTDEQLFLEFRSAGDEQLFEVIVARYRRQLLTFLTRQLHDASLAEEALQQVFLKVFHKREQFQSGRAFRPWIYQIARNQSIDSRRRESRHDHLSLDRPELNGDPQHPLSDVLVGNGRLPDEEAQLRETAIRSREAVDQLPDHMRKTVNLVYRDQLKYGEVAESLSVPLGTVKSRMNNALRRLRAIMTAPHPAPAG